MLNPVAGSDKTPFRWCTPHDFLHVREDTPRFHFVNSVMPHVTKASDSELRIVNRNYQAWANLANFFTWSPEAVSKAAFCEVVGSRAEKHITAFVAQQFGNNQHFVLTRGTKHSAAIFDNVAAVRFVTGLCLFSDSNLTAIASDGNATNILNARHAITRKIVDIISGPELSLYEIESSVRLSKNIADIAKFLPSDISIAITLDVPRVQYYCYLIDAYEKNYVERDLLMRWFELVDQRHSMVAAFMRCQIGKWFLSNRLPKPDIDIGSGLDAVSDSIRVGITNGRVPTPAELALLLAKNNDIWLAAEQVSESKTFEDIIYRSYCIEQSRSVIDPKNEVVSKILTIAVDNREEQRIYERSHGLIKQLRVAGSLQVSPLIGFYPLEPIFVANVPRFALYYGDLGKCFVDETGSEYTPSELVSAIYD